MLCVIETHPVQYHAPVYRVVQERFGIPVTAVYGSNFSVVGYTDREFGARFAWDVDLLGGYTACYLKTVGNGGAESSELVSARGLTRVLSRLQPQAILLLGYSPRFYQQSFFAAWRTGRPLLFRGETTDHARTRSRLKSWMRDQALRWFYGQCSRLLYVGQNSREHFLRLGCSPGKMGFSPYCVDTSPFQTEEADRARVRDATRQELGIKPDQHVLVFSGKLSPRKGVDVLLRAVKAFPAPVRAKLVVLYVGAGELQESLRVEALLEPQVTVRFTGFQNQRQISRFYHAADVLVLPSVWSETWGLVVNDALHHGLPCVVSNAVGCAPDLVVPGVTGDVAEAGSVDALRAAIERVLPLVNQDNVRKACRARVEAYTVFHAAKGIAEAYNRTA